MEIKVLGSKPFEPMKGEARKEYALPPFSILGDDKLLVCASLPETKKK